MPVEVNYRPFRAHVVTSSSAFSTRSSSASRRSIYSPQSYHCQEYPPQLACPKANAITKQRAFAAKNTNPLPIRIHRVPIAPAASLAVFHRSHSCATAAAAVVLQPTWRTTTFTTRLAVARTRSCTKPDGSAASSTSRSSPRPRAAWIRCGGGPFLLPHKTLPLLTI